MVKTTDVKKAGEHILRYTGIPAKQGGNLRTGTVLRIPIELIKKKLIPTEAPDEDDESIKRERGVKSPVARPAQVHVILDAGHGGGDPGASGNKLKEYQVTHDLRARIAALLRKHGYNVHELVDNTHVNFPNKQVKLVANAKTNLNNRIAAANQQFTALLKNGVHSEHVALVSIHADSAHPDHAGVMVMTPSATFTKRRGTKVSPHRSQALSDQLGEHIIQQTRRLGLPPVENDPVRESIVRKGRVFVPGIIGKTRVPTAVLVETGNLRSKRDASRLTGKRYSYAAGIANGITAHYK